MDRGRWRGYDDDDRSRSRSRSRDRVRRPSPPRPREAMANNGTTSLPPNSMMPSVTRMKMSTGRGRISSAVTVAAGAAMREEAAAGAHIMRTALPVRSAAAEAKDVVMRAAREVLAPILCFFSGCCWLLLATLLLLLRVSF